MTASCCSPLDLKQIANAQILDVRTDIEHKEQCLDCAHKHVPLDRLDPAALVASGDIDPHKPLYILCRLGGRAAKAAQMFKDAGFDNVVVIEGGIVACAQNGMQTRCARNVISLERQVRMIAGLLVMTGVSLGWLVTPGFYLLALFVGMGLTVAGITGWCGMALLLAKAPWNKG